VRLVFVVLIHAEIVMLFTRSSLEFELTITTLFDPLKLRASFTLPATGLAFRSTPFKPLPERSSTVDPEMSAASKDHVPDIPPGGVFTVVVTAGLTVIFTLADLLLSARLVAVKVTDCWLETLEGAE